MARRILVLLYCLIALEAFADMLVVVLDRELDSPLEGAQVWIQGSDEAVTTNDRGEAASPCPPGTGASCSRRGSSATRP